MQVVIEELCSSQTAGFVHELLPEFPCPLNGVFGILEWSSRLKYHTGETGPLNFKAGFSNCRYVTEKESQ